MRGAATIRGGSHLNLPRIATSTRQGDGVKQSRIRLFKQTAIIDASGPRYVIARSARRSHLNGSTCSCRSQLAFNRTPVSSARETRMPIRH